MPEVAVELKRRDTTVAHMVGGECVHDPALSTKLMNADDTTIKLNNTGGRASTSDHTSTIPNELGFVSNNCVLFN